MDLMCCESETVQKAYVDPVLINDDRVLNNLLNTEDRYIPSSSYFKCVQTDIKPYMRTVVAQWMLEVCQEQNCEDEVFPLSMNYLDRFLSIRDLHRSKLQLLAATCMFIASKLQETNPLPAERLVIYTDNSISLQDLMDMELIVLSKLKWDLSAVTPHDFLEHIMCRLPIHKEQSESIKKHAQTFIALCATDCKFMMYPPSMIAACSIGASSMGLLDSQYYHHLRVLERLHTITGIEMDCLRSCQEQIEQALNAYLSSGNEEVSAESQGKSSTLEGQPTTPTDVQDIHF